MKITIGIDGKGAAKALKDVDKYKRWLDKKINELVKRLAEYGMEVAQVSFNNATYDGEKDVKVRVEPCTGEPYAYKVIAEGHATLFIEFGSGAKFGGGHPTNLYEMGSWSLSPQGKGHWADPNGWYYAHDKKSWGNPPSKSMYDARTAVGNKIGEIAREVFNS